MFGEGNRQGVGSEIFSGFEKSGDPAAVTPGVVKELGSQRDTPAVGLPRASLPSGDRIHQAPPCHPLLSSGRQSSARPREFSIEQRRNTKQQVQTFSESGILLVNAGFECVKLTTKLGEISSCQGEPRPLRRDIRTIRIFFRQLRQTALCTLDFQLIEISNGEVEKHPSGDVPISGRLKETIGSQLVTIGLEASPLIESGRTQIMLDQPEKTRAQRIIRQQFEQAAH